MATLIYKFPNEVAIHHQHGKFHQLLTGEEPTGFVVTDFLHQQVFLFQQNEDIPQSVYYSKNKPYVISKRDYQIEAQALLNAFSISHVDKAVYSRVKSVPFDATKAEELFEQLCNQYPAAFCYFISSEYFGTWIGATPEVLVKSEGKQLETIALAGTHPSAVSSTWTEKESEEHQYVVTAINQTLARNACKNIQKSDAYEVNAGPVVHLKTDFSAETTTNSPWAIAMDLHPTPAVCGTPRMNALDLLLSREMHQRDLYAGVIGWNDGATSRLFVNLRCAQLIDQHAFLYVGGGYTKDSIPDLEWDETENKARTILNAIETL
jgi:isochorismate synthase